MHPHAAVLHPWWRTAARLRACCLRSWSAAAPFADPAVSASASASASGGWAADREVVSRVDGTAEAARRGARTEAEAVEAAAGGPLARPKAGAALLVAAHARRVAAGHAWSICCRVAGATRPPSVGFPSCVPPG